MRKKKKFKRKQFRLTNPMRNISEVLMAEAGELPDAHFRTNVQAEILCTGDTFRVRPKDPIQAIATTNNYSFSRMPLRTATCTASMHTMIRRG